MTLFGLLAKLKHDLAWRHPTSGRLADMIMIERCDAEDIAKALIQMAAQSSSGTDMEGRGNPTM